MLVGYARVSTQSQSIDRQVDALIEAGVDRRSIYQEKASGKRCDRPELQRMLNGLQPGDTVIVAETTRVSRSTKDLLELVDAIRSKGAEIRSLSEPWLDTTDASPMAEFIRTVMAGFSQLERQMTSERVKDGLKAAKARGRKGGRPSKANAHSEAVKMLYRGGMRISDIAEHEGISRTTVYKIIGEACSGDERQSPSSNQCRQDSLQPPRTRR